jgi:hypothetical protein
MVTLAGALKVELLVGLLMVTVGGALTAAEVER